MDELNARIQVAVLERALMEPAVIRGELCPSCPFRTTECQGKLRFAELYDGVRIACRGTMHKRQIEG